MALRDGIGRRAKSGGELVIVLVVNSPKRFLRPRLMGTRCGANPHRNANITND